MRTFPVSCHVVDRVAARREIFPPNRDLHHRTVSASSSRTAMRALGYRVCKELLRIRSRCPSPKKSPRNSAASISLTFGIPKNSGLIVLILAPYPPSSSAPAGAVLDFRALHGVHSV